MSGIYKQKSMMQPRVSVLWTSSPTSAAREYRRFERTARKSRGLCSLPCWYKPRKKCSERMATSGGSSCRSFPATKSW